MTEEPVVTPVTTPPLTVALALLLLQAPPVMALPRVTVLPTHTVVAPVIAPALGEGLTVIAFRAVSVPQPFVTTYAIVTVPAATPVTSPLVETVAIAALPVIQMPPAAVLESAVVPAGQTVAVPETVPALAPNVTAVALVAIAVPQELVTE